MDLEEEAKKLKKLRTAREKVSKKYRELGKQIEAAEANVILLMEAENMQRVTFSRIGTVSRSELLVPRMVDWDKFTKYVRRKNAFHLLEQRPAAKACREVYEQGLGVPGTESFTRKSIRITKPS